MGINVQRRMWTRDIVYGAMGSAMMPLAATVPPLKMAVMSVMPLGMVDDTGKPYGMYTDIGARAVRNAGLELDIAVAPLPRAIAQLAAGQTDLLIAFETEAIVKAALPLFYVTDVDVVIAGRRGSSFRDLSDLRGRTVAQQRGADYDPRFTADSAIKKYEVTNTQQLVRMLLAGRVDAVIANRNTLLYYLQSAGITRQELGTFLLVRRRQSWLWYSKKKYDARIALKLKVALRQMHDHGEVKQIYQHYIKGLPEGVVDK